MIWIVLLAIVVGMCADLAYPEHARATLDHARAHDLSRGSLADRSWDHEHDPWIDLGGES